MSAKTGGPAFPSVHLAMPATGMTLRDYFAAKAMQGLLSAGRGFVYVAEDAYKAADAMLAAREAK